MAYTSPTAGSRITSSLLNSMVGDETSFVPSWEADSGSTTLGDGTLTGSYRIVGSRCDFNIEFNWGSTTTQSVAGSNWSFDLPVTAASGPGNTFNFVDIWIRKASNDSRWQAAGYVNGTDSTIRTIVVNADVDAMDNNNSPTLTAEGSVTTTVQPGAGAWAVNDRLNIRGSYEIA